MGPHVKRCPRCKKVPIAKLWVLSELRRPLLRPPLLPEGRPDGELRVLSNSNHANGVAQCNPQPRRREAMTNAEQIKNTENLRGAALREKFREVVGAETRSKDRPYLIRKIVQALEACAETAPREVATPTQNAPQCEAAAPEAKAARKTKKAPVTSQKRERDPRLPAPGTVLEREHDGKTIRVKVLEDGFEFRGKAYRSLSAVAREATGTTWNGLLFFRLIPYAKREKAAA